MLRIGFDAKRLLNNFTGFGNYSRTLIADLVTHHPEHDYFLFTPDITDTVETQRLFESPSIKVVSPPRYRQFFWRSFGMRIDLNRYPINLFHGLTHEIPKAVTSLKIPKIVTICDVVYKHFPHSYPASKRNKKDRAISMACSHADGIIAISESTKQDLINFFSIEPDRISVIYPSCDERFRKTYSRKSIDSVKNLYDLPETYTLYVGSVTERKNLLVACQALRRIPEKSRSSLVVVGKQSGYSEIVVNYITKHHLEQWVTFAQVTSNDDLPLVYQGAELFIYPSLYEGFGIPVLEALCCGLPVITSNVSSLPEVAGADSKLIDPSEPDTIASAITGILTDKELRAKMISAGYAHSLRFNGNRIAQELNDFYLRFCAP